MCRPTVDPVAANRSCGGLRPHRSETGGQMRNPLGRADRSARHHHHPSSRDDGSFDSGRWRFDPNLPLLDHTPTADQVSAWIDSIVSAGIRRPGRPADGWTESWLLRELTALGLEEVVSEPVATTAWEPG